ncbi:MAG: hypothetical protein ACOCWC_02085 [Bacteroidota bacterium]
MSAVKIIVADSSDIMLNGILSYIISDPEITICGKATKYHSLCEEIESTPHDLVLIGPMMLDRYRHSFKEIFLQKYPNIKMIHVDFADSPMDIIRKIKNYANGAKIHKHNLFEFFSSN